MKIFMKCNTFCIVLVALFLASCGGGNEGNKQAAPDGPTVSSPSPADAATVAAGSSGQMLRVYAPEATSGTFHYDGDSVIDNSISATVNGDYLEATIPYVTDKMNNNGTNYWYVEASNASGTTRYPASGQLSFTVSSSAPPSVSTPNPSNGATVAAGSSGQLLRVYAPGATVGTFYYDGDTAIDYSIAATVSGDYLQATIPYATGQMNNNGTNYWYVQATNVYGTTRYPASGQLSFTVSTGPAVSNPYPSNGAAVAAGGSGQLLRVYAPEATGGTFHYDDSSTIAYSMAATVSGGYLEVTIPYAVGKMYINGKNWWYVEATNGYGTTRYPASGQLSFTVSPGPVVSNPKPSNGASVVAGSSGQLLQVYAPGAVSGTFHYDDTSTIAHSMAATVNGDYLEVTIPYAEGQMNINGTNYWYVEATNAIGTTRYPASGQLYFMVLSAPAVSRPNPSDGATVVPGRSGQVLKVYAPEATSGTFYYDGDTAIDYSIAATVSGDYLMVMIPYVAGQMNNNGTNYWYVQATNAYGTTRYPATGELSFTVSTSGFSPSTWLVDYDWDCNGSPGSIYWYLDSDNTFTDSMGYNHGTWSLTGSTFTLVYSVGTTFTGTVSGDSMSGTMTATGSSGCWTATFVP